MNLHSPSPVDTDNDFGERATPANALPGMPEGLDLRRIFVAFRRRLRLFAAVAMAVLLASVLVTLQATPKYSATVRRQRR